MYIFSIVNFVLESCTNVARSDNHVDEIRCIVEALKLLQNPRKSVLLSRGVISVWIYMYRHSCAKAITCA